MEACHVKRGQGSYISIPQIPVGKFAYQNCSRDQLSPRGGRELHRPQWQSHTVKNSHKICEGGCAPARPTKFGPPTAPSPRMSAFGGKADIGATLRNC